MSFGGGYAGFKAASAGQTDRIVYQAPTSTPASGTGTTAANLVGVINAVNPSVVAVTTEQMVTSNFWGGQQVVSSGAGSGVDFTADGYIITNNHVIEGAQQIKVKLSDDTEYTAKLIGTDSQSDIAVLKIDATGLTPRCSAIPTVCRWANCPSRWQPLGTSATPPPTASFPAWTARSLQATPCASCRPARP